MNLLSGGIGMSTEKFIYVLLTDTGTWFTRLIKLATRSPLNHASISFDRELHEVYSFGRKNPDNPFIGGFVKEDMSNKLFYGAACALYRCPVDSQTYEQMKQYIYRIEQEKQDYKYNFLGLFGVLLKIRYERKNAYFCSQFVAAVLEQSGFSIAGKPSCMVRPNDFCSLPDFTLVYEGPLNPYVRQTGSAVRLTQTA